MIKLSILDESFSQFSTDQDRNLLSSCCEKVVMPKLVNIVRSSYDPVSTSQANKLVGCLFRLVSDFPTLTPRSKQLRELLSVVLDMVKECLFSILPKTVLVSFQALQECLNIGGK